MKEYDFRQAEKKWQKEWERQNVFHAEDFSKKEKFYGLIEFPYPSGSGLHIGHIRAYTPLEVISRKKRLEGRNVLFPIGWDAFGLPTENYAIKTGIHPRKVTDENIKIFTEQLRSIGYSFDWSRELDTSGEEYYKWTQWIFLKLYEKGLAYKDHTYVNFCPECRVVLSNEESQGGKCDRCDSDVVQKEKEVWMLKITDYAEKLLEGLDEVNYIPMVRVSQENWIGKSAGAEVNFKLEGEDTNLRVFTTRPDTLFGATFMVIAPEHPMIEQFKNRIQNLTEVEQYREQAKKKTEFERVELAKEKTGIEIKGIKAINPVTQGEMPIWVADYVMMGYGTGAIMAVPAHDTRDFEFATKFDIPIVQVIQKAGEEETTLPFTEDGIMIHSDFLNGMDVKKSKEEMIQYLEKQKMGTRKINYKMKDWAFARQRYWGEPVPIIHCPVCGMVAVPEKDLPVTLPDVKNFKPGVDGESPLADIHEWVNVKCPKCGMDAKRETDTMPQWAGSSWYFLRYIDPHNHEELGDKKKLDYWMNVDWYSGGMEHVTRHLIYSRFWHRFLYDIGVVSTREPYAKRTAHGLLLGSDGEKMSKSRGNVVNPNEMVETYGADAFRLAMLFVGDYENAIVWSEDTIRGAKRFLERTFKLLDLVAEGKGYSKELEAPIHKTIKGVSEDLENAKFNTAIAKLMTLINTFYDHKKITREDLLTFITLLNPIAPHITEEMWQEMNGKGLLALGTWPSYDPAKLIEKEIEIPIQVNGKVKAKIVIAIDETEESVLEKARESLKGMVDVKEIVKQIYVQGKIVNIVAK